MKASNHFSLIEEETRKQYRGHEKWGPAQWGGADAPYKCFRPWRKPWRRRNSLPPSIGIIHGYQKERHDLRRVFLFGGPDRIRTDDPHNAKLDVKFFLIILNTFESFLF